ncbi:hypothetical protein JQ625_18335 [Bradyrhizobium diazoefficiens]|nr:hypothetical protein [Bradyrhizobium diazoefficiens]MBR0776798.1 hypothetical protein [Bradyrhizobium diazoefficiens]
MTRLSISVAAVLLASPGPAAGFFNNPFPYQDACKSAAYAAVPPGRSITGTSVKMENNNQYSISVATDAGGKPVTYRFLCSWANGNVKIVKRSAGR